MNLSELLKNIKERPEMYLGDKTIDSLATYIHGFEAAAETPYSDYIKRYAPGSKRLHGFDDFDKAIDAAISGAEDAEFAQEIRDQKNSQELRKKAKDALMAHALSSQSFKWYANEYREQPPYDGHPIKNSSGSNDTDEYIGVAYSIRDAEFIAMAHEVMPLFAKTILEMIEEEQRRQG